MPENSPEYWKNKGNESFKVNNFEDAAKCYIKAIDMDPKYSDAWNNLALTFSRLGRLKDAQVCIDKVKEIKEKPFVSNVELKPIGNDQRKNPVISNVSQPSRKFRGLITRKRKIIFGKCDNKWYISPIGKFIAAYFIDLIILCLVFNLLNPQFGLWNWLLFLILAFVYFNFCEFLFKRTIGHALFHNFLVDERNQIIGKISAYRLLLRNAIKTFEIYFFIPYWLEVSIQDKITKIRYFTK